MAVAAGCYAAGKVAQWCLSEVKKGWVLATDPVESRAMEELGEVRGQDGRLVSQAQRVGPLAAVVAAAIAGLIDEGTDSRKRRIPTPNPIVEELVWEAKLKYGNLMPTVANQYIVRDFMNATIQEWRADPAKVPEITARYLTSLRRSQMAGIAARATAKYWQLTETEEYAHKVVTSEVVRSQYSRST